MRKKKLKTKKVYHRFVFWVGVAVIGGVVGLAIQFARAWVEPSATAPSGNIAAPINTGATTQTKTGGDIYVDINGSTRCLSNASGGSGGGGDYIFALCTGGVSWYCTAYCPSGYRKTSQVNLSAYGYWQGLALCAPHTSNECTTAGGTPVQDGATSFCQFSRSSCPSGWAKYKNWSETLANTCNGTHVGSCSGKTSCTATGHTWANTATETCSYINEINGQTWNPQYVCSTYYGSTYCSASDATSCEWGLCGEEPCLVCLQSCGLDTSAAYGCGSYSYYCATQSATCTANVTKIGCY
ncbi:MAG: hypothetical protein QMD77_01690 [Patescibacteria group bacterium]|nr:hypothetical protein [Patescibacteria group bacterium]